MLAYVFWHVPDETASRAVYEGLLTAFHAALAGQGTAGVRGSRAYRVGGATWLGPGAYEDWYLLDDSAAIDALNRDAVTGPAADPHAAVAARMQRGMGGLLALMRGGGRGGPLCRWLAKPRGMDYPHFYAALEPALAAPGSSLWRRQMVLGPTPEFCLIAAADAPVPPGWEVARTARQRVWPAGAD